MQTKNAKRRRTEKKLDDQAALRVSASPQSIGELLEEPGGTFLPYAVGQYLEGSDLLGLMQSHRGMGERVRPLSLAQRRSLAQCWRSAASGASTTWSEELADFCLEQMAQDVARFVIDVLWAPVRPPTIFGIRNSQTGEQREQRLDVHGNLGRLDLLPVDPSLGPELSFFGGKTSQLSAELMFTGHSIPFEAELAITKVFRDLRNVARSTSQTPPLDMPESVSFQSPESRVHLVKREENYGSDRQLQLPLLEKLLRLTLPFARRIDLPGLRISNGLRLGPREYVFSVRFADGSPLLGIPLDVQESLPNVGHIPLPAWLEEFSR